MKKEVVRKHGYKARAQTIERWMTLSRGVENVDIVETTVPTARLTTQVTFESESRSYLWTTDRGRSRLIKH